MILYGALTILALGGATLADLDVADYIYWKKADIAAWHEFFPLRAIQEEQLTVNAALSTLTYPSLGLDRIVVFQQQELENAILLMDGTAAQSCVSGIKSYMNDAVAAALNDALDCIADSTSKITRLNKTLDQVRSTYTSAYQRAVNGIDVCARIYPNKAQLARLQSCVESMSNSYFQAANQTQGAVFPSPTMTYFIDTPIDCARTAASTVVAKGWQFLQFLGECAALDPSIDQQAYADQLNSWSGFNDTLIRQISDCQTQNYYQVWGVEKEMQDYYNRQKTAMEKYVVESRGLEYYRQAAFSYLADFYNILAEVPLDFSDLGDCVATATQALDIAANTSAWESLSCDQFIVNDTLRLVGDVRKAFSALNQEMPSLGNPTLLNCLTQGYIFAPETLTSCFRLSYLRFNISLTQVNQQIAQDLDILSGYENSFFSGSGLPCGVVSAQKLSLDGQRALYDLDRCLYMYFGSSYSYSIPTTTPQPEVTTTVAAYSTMHYN